MIVFAVDLVMLLNGPSTTLQVSLGPEFVTSLLQMFLDKFRKPFLPFDNNDFYLYPFNT